MNATLVSIFILCASCIFLGSQSRQAGEAVRGPKASGRPRGEAGGSEVRKSIANADRVLKETHEELYGARPPLPWPQTLLITFGLVFVMWYAVYLIISGPMLDAQRKTVAEKYEQLVQQEAES